jgi:hypothetical protein
LNKIKRQAAKYGPSEHGFPASVYAAFLSSVLASFLLVNSSSNAIMELVLTKILHNTSLAASPSLLRIGFALVAALASLLGIFLRRPKKAAVPVFKVQGDVVKALEEAHQAVCTNVSPKTQVCHVYRCSFLTLRSSSQWLVKK